MLQTNKKQSLTEGTSEPGVISPAETLEVLVSFVRRQFPIIVFIALLALALGGAYVISTPPSYTASATMIIDTRKVQLFQQQSILGDIPIDSASVESQVQILKSEQIALAVIKALHLTDSPEFSEPSGGLIGAILSFGLNLLDVGPPKSEFERARQAIRVFEDRLGIKRVGLSYVIEISFRSQNPERAAQIANAIADAYVVDQLGAKYEATRRAGIWLQDRIKELRQQASAAERAVVDFKTKNNIVTTGGTGGRLVSEQQVAEQSSQLVLVRAQTADARAKLDRIETVLRADSPDATVNSTVTDTLKNEVITKLRSQYLDLANREADWSSRYGKDHLAAVNLRNQMQEIRNSILDELRRIAEGYKSDYQIAKAREEQIQIELGQAVSQSQETNQAQVTLRELESSSQTYRTLYDNFLQRYMESIQQQSFPISDARVISQASPPLQKSHPKTALILGGVSIAGLILGFGVGLIREWSDRVFRTVEQVESLLRMDCIAVVPLLQSGETGKNTHSTAVVGPRRIVRDKTAFWVVVDAPFSRFAEAIRSMKLAVDLNGVVRSNKVVGFTSSAPNEGKSTIAVALAALMSQVGAKTILVDCDIRNPSISRILTPNASRGLFEVLTGKCSLEEVVCIEESTKMEFLPAVIRARVAHSNEILSSGAMKKLFDNLRQIYDYVVVDFPPLSPVIDVRATTHLVDSYIFVIEWGGTKFDVVEHALASAPLVQENLLGVVLNKTNMEIFGRYEGYRESYYSPKHSERYGYTE